MLTLRQQIAQMLIIGFAGTEIKEDSLVTSWLSEGIGGVILFDYDLPNKKQGKNLINQQQVKHLNGQLQLFASRSFFSQYYHLPLFTAIDYEGGAVNRLREIQNTPKTLSPAEYALLPPAQRVQEATQMAAILQSLGFNLNFAPVVDLNLNGEQGIIGRLQRSFSSNPQTVVKLAAQFVEIFAQHGITCCYKHFPGHGSAIGDTHEGFVDVSYFFQTEELEPYRLLVANKQLPVMVMTAHVINRHLDPQNLPATLSKPILNDLLKEKIGFEGVVISDDLQMKAISDHYSLAESLKLTINAGADMVIFGNQLGNITATEVIDTIENLVKEELISPTRIDEAFQRICRLKKHFNGSYSPFPAP